MLIQRTDNLSNTKIKIEIWWFPYHAYVRDGKKDAIPHLRLFKYQYQASLF